MTIPRLIFIGMALLAFADGWYLQGGFLIALCLILQWLRPGEEYRRWE